MKIIIAIAALICLGLIGGGVYLATKHTDPGPRKVALSPAYTARVSEGGWVEGSTTPQAKLIEYGDFQCPACEAYYPIITQAFSETSDYTQFEFRNYPLVNLHDKARLAAEGAESAGRQGKFWDMYNTLYTDQPQWESQSTFDFRNTLIGYAKDLKLNADQFQSDLDDSTVDDQINTDMKNGDAIKLQGTPTLVLNGKTIDPLPQSKDDLVAAIKAAAGK